jgi:alpha-tubulin suppressor-like RCC1 family protein
MKAREISMLRRLGVFGSTGALLASAFVAVATLGMSAAQAASFQDWVTVSAGYADTCGVRNNGKLYCWGRDNEGQIGDGDATGAIAPRRIGSFEDWDTVVAGDTHTCGIRHGGKLYCWGRDDNGQVGDGGELEASILAPRRVGDFEDWATVSTGSSHTCGVRRNGKLYCWGYDFDGQIGNGAAGPLRVDAPKRIGSFDDWDTVVGGDAQTCGIRHGGKLYCWGYDAEGEVGNGGATGNVDAPQRIGIFDDWATVDAGYTQTCGIRHGGKLYCWGGDADGEVGDGGDNEMSIDAPRRIGSFEDWGSASAGGKHSAGVRKNGKLYCWGDDFYGQIGDGESPGPVNEPRRI